MISKIAYLQNPELNILIFGRVIVILPLKGKKKMLENIFSDRKCQKYFFSSVFWVHCTQNNQQELPVSMQKSVIKLCTEFQDNGQNV